MLMEDKANALQVYNALNESSYDDPEQVEIVSLERGISLSIRNDAAFIVDMSINIYEHQSNYNPNMPIRSLIYYTAYLKKQIHGKDLLGSKLIKIPTPHFAVFYNGIGNRPEEEVLRLSDSFEKPMEHPELDLICKIYNINPGKNKGILSRCMVLDEYTRFVETVRRFEADGEDEPVEQAIDYCINNHILEEFLKKRRAEVLKVMTIDMTFERREEIWREEKEKERKRADDAEKSLEAANKRIAELEALLAEKS